MVCEDGKLVRGHKIILRAGSALIKNLLAQGLYLYLYLFCIWLCVDQDSSCSGLVFHLILYNNNKKSCFPVHHIISPIESYLFVQGSKPAHILHVPAPQRHTLAIVRLFLIFCQWVTKSCLWVTKYSLSKGSSILVRHLWNKLMLLHFWRLRNYFRWSCST